MTAATLLPADQRESVPSFLESIVVHISGQADEARRPQQGWEQEKADQN